MSDYYESINKKDIPRVSKRLMAFETGERHYSEYDEDTLIEMLQSTDISEVYEAFGAVGKLKLKAAIPHLKAIAFYDDDIATQEDAIRTIRKVGGRTCMDILRALKTTEHKDLVEDLLSGRAE